MIVRAKDAARYVAIGWATARDSSLSWEARGMLVALLSRPDNWEVSERQLVSESKAGAAVVRRILKELERAGHFVREKIKDRNGRFTYKTTIYEVPSERELVLTREDEEAPAPSEENTPPPDGWNIQVMADWSRIVRGAAPVPRIMKALRERFVYEILQGAERDAAWAIVRGAWCAYLEGEDLRFVSPETFQQRLYGRYRDRVVSVVKAPAAPKPAAAQVINLMEALACATKPASR